MEEKLFAELVESIEEMGAYLRGEIPPERLLVVHYPEYTHTIILGPDDPRCTPPAPEIGTPPASISAARTNAR